MSTNEMANETTADADPPLTTAASVVLDSPPHNANAALQSAGDFTQSKVTIHLIPLPNTPALRVSRLTCMTDHEFVRIVRFLRSKLKLQNHESIICYVNSVFAPGLDEKVGNLWQCFRTENELVVYYSMAPAIG